MRHLFLFCISMIATTIHAQQVYTYTFDDQDYGSSTGGANATSTSLPTFECGMSNDGIYFDGKNSNLIFPVDAETYFDKDFTIDFYFRIEEASSVTDILSLRNSCEADSMIAIRYDPQENAIISELARDNDNPEPLDKLKLDPNKCWNRLTITKNDLIYSVILNNDKKVEYKPRANIVLGEGTQLSIANSPCLESYDTRFKGWIDEFRILPWALSKTELTLDYRYPDEITTKDTTLLKGQFLDLTVGATCSKDISWSPKDAIVSGEGSKSIRLQADKTRTYSVTIKHQASCTTTDTIRVYVFDEDQKDCTKLMLPKAFTANGDGINDTYGIDNTFIVEDVKVFEVYDKNGAILWRGRNKNDRWDGTYNGTYTNGGMYLYRISYTCDGKEFVKVDNFALLR